MLIEIMASRFPGCFKGYCEYADTPILFEEDVSGVHKFYFEVSRQIESPPNKMTSENQLEDFVDKMMEKYIQSPQ